MLNRSRRPAERSRAWMRASSASTGAQGGHRRRMSDAVGVRGRVGVAEPEDGDRRIDALQPGAEQRVDGVAVAGRGWAWPPAAADPSCSRTAAPSSGGSA